MKTIKSKNNKKSDLKMMAELMNCCDTSQITTLVTIAIPPRVAACQVAWTQQLIKRRVHNRRIERSEPPHAHLRPVARGHVHPRPSHRRGIETQQLRDLVHPH